MSGTDVAAHHRPVRLMLSGRRLTSVNPRGPYGSQLPESHAQTVTGQTVTLQAQFVPENLKMMAVACIWYQRVSTESLSVFVPGESFFSIRIEYKLQDPVQTGPTSTTRSHIPGTNRVDGKPVTNVRMTCYQIEAGG
eukprot:2253912-Rhodomonas_salina.1